MSELAHFSLYTVMCRLDGKCPIFIFLVLLISYHFIYMYAFLLALFLSTNQLLIFFICFKPQSLSRSRNYFAKWRVG